MGQNYCEKDCPFRSPTCHCTCEKYAKRMKQDQEIKNRKEKERLLMEYNVENMKKRYEKKRGG